MSWRDELRPASLDGVAFFIREHTRYSGRRLVVHEYPFQELPEPEQLGAQPKRFQVDAYVLGDDYLQARDALLAVLDAPGTKRLVHPWHGELDVVIEDEVAQSESTREGGLSQFRFTCLQVQLQSLPRVTVDTRQAVQIAAGATDTAAAAAFGAGFNPTAYDALEGAMRSVTAAFEAAEQGLARLEDYASLANRLLQLPEAIATRIQSDLARLGALRLRTLAGFGTGLHSDRAIDAANNAAVEQLVQAGAVVALVRISAGADYASYDEAIATRDELLDRIEQLQGAADDELYAALVDLRRTLASDIEARGADLRRLTRFAMTETTPALALVQRLYGPARLEADLADLLARNGIDEPLFVPGGVSLEVLTP